MHSPGKGARHGLLNVLLAAMETSAAEGCLAGDAAGFASAFEGDAAAAATPPGFAPALEGDAAAAATLRRSASFS